MLFFSCNTRFEIHPFALLSTNSPHIILAFGSSALKKYIKITGARTVKFIVVVIVSANINRMDLYLVGSIFISVYRCFFQYLRNTNSVYKCFFLVNERCLNLSTSFKSIVRGVFRTSNIYHTGFYT